MCPAEGVEWPRSTSATVVAGFVIATRSAISGRDSFGARPTPTASPARSRSTRTVVRGSTRGVRTSRWPNGLRRSCRSRGRWHRPRRRRIGATWIGMCCHDSAPVVSVTSTSGDARSVSPSNSYSSATEAGFVVNPRHRLACGRSRSRRRQWRSSIDISICSRHRALTRWCSRTVLAHRSLTPAFTPTTSSPPSPLP